MLDNLLTQLKNTHFRPNLYVIKNAASITKIKENPQVPIKYFNSYDDIIAELSEKTQKKRISGLNPAF